jgi:oligopeptide transport system substrate-binding protein
MRLRMILFLCMLSTVVAAQWNNPHENRVNKNVRYSPFQAQPKTLDPAKAYSADAYQFIAQIYEPPLQYDYFNNLDLVGLTTNEQIQVRFFNKQGCQIFPGEVMVKGVTSASSVSDLSKGGSPSENLAVKAVCSGKKTDKVEYTLYDITIKPNIMYQDHPALARKDDGTHRYQKVQPQEWNGVYALNDFKHRSTRELTAEDYVYQIKRMASPKINSPIYQLLSEHIEGFEAYSEKLKQLCSGTCSKGKYLDLNRFPISGVKVINRYHFQIKVKGIYRQFMYWLAMPFFAPIPHEADRFYSQPGMKERNISFDWYPIGTGPYFLSVNDPNKEMILERNKNFRGEKFPQANDHQNILASDKAKAGKAMPFIDRFVFSLDKESIPRWNKFLQGYYDSSGIGTENFDQAVRMDAEGKALLTEEMVQKGIQLQTMQSPSIYYVGFNMEDPVVGGLSKQKRALRQAISIAVDYEEYVELFLNGRGQVAQSPIPPGIWGYSGGEKGMNSVVYNWTGEKLKRKPIDDAKQLMVKAGYPGGIDPSTNRPLLLYFDSTASGHNDTSTFKWYRKQFAKIGIDLQNRVMDYNTFQDNAIKGKLQIFNWGWNADYPDPENFFFLFDSQNAKHKTGKDKNTQAGSENAVNYRNPEFDRLFQEMRSLPNGIERQKKVDALVHLLQKDSPWMWGFFPLSYSLTHDWYDTGKVSAINNNTLKYKSLNPKLRAQKQHDWNEPLLWPLFGLLALLTVLGTIGVIVYRRNDNRSRTKRVE